LRRERIHLVHIYFNDAAIIIPLFARLAGCKVVTARRDMGISYTRKDLFLRRIVGRLVDRVIANSHAVASCAIEREWLARGRTRVVYNGYDFTRGRAPAEAGLRARLGIAATDSIVGMVANLRTVKRHADLIRAFVEVHRRHANAHLVMVGTGPLRDALIRQVSATGLGDRVHFLGSVSNVIPIVKHFAVGVLCSDSEGFSNALIEYMASGLSPVCTRTGGNVELVDDGENGFLVEVGDIQALADRISRLLADAVLARQMGEAARQRASNYTMSRMSTETTQLYRELLSEDTPT
jgi:glycosyltransferase involved in cell wall biosynthesis